MNKNFIDFSELEKKATDSFESAVYLYKKDVILKNNLEILRIIRSDEKLNNEQNILVEDFKSWSLIKTIIPEKYGKKNKNNQYLEEFYNIISEEDFECISTQSETTVKYPDYILQAIWFYILRTSKEKENLSILHSNAEIGGFYKNLPNKNLNINFTFLEENKIYFEIFKKLYPEQKVHNLNIKNFYPEKTFDIVFSTPAFSDNLVYDSDFSGENTFTEYELSLRKSIEIVKPQGIVIGLFNAWISDKIDSANRIEILKHAKLMKALRLPGSILTGGNGINTTIDFLVFEKRDTVLNDNNFYESISQDEEFWISVIDSENFSFLEDKNESKIGNKFINSYFDEYPDNIIGELNYVNNKFTKNTHDVVMEDFFIENLLKKLKANDFSLSSRENVVIEKFQNATSNDELEKYEIEGHLLLVDGEIHRIESNNKLDKRIVKLNLNETENLILKPALILKEIMLHVIQAESINVEEEEISFYRELLNESYDKFFTKNKINEFSWPEIFVRDPWYGRFIALEIFDSSTETYKKSDIFYKRLISVNIDELSEYSIEEAFYKSYQKLNAVDINDISKISNKPELEVIKEILEKKLAYRVNDFDFEESSKYLSGNIANKIQEAMEFGYTENVNDLKAILPKKIMSNDINVNIGATWINIEYLILFLEEVTGLSIHNKNIKGIIYNKNLSMWRIQENNFVIADNNKNKEFFTKEYSTLEMFEALLNSKNLKVTYKDHGNTIVDWERTIFVQEISRKIKDSFINWLWSDQERKDNLVTIYNNKFNSFVEFKPKNKKYFFSEMNNDIILRENQISSVLRGINEGFLAAIHPVGGGKTFIQGVLAHEWKAKGYCHKPMLVVKNNSLGEYTRELQRLYPKDNILSISSETLKTEEDKKQLFNIINNNDWDMVIITHSLFSLIKLSKDELLNQLKIEYDEVNTEFLSYYPTAFTEEKKDKIYKLYIKKLEKISNEINVLQDPEFIIKSKYMGFDLLDIDALIVDEFHNFKNTGESVIGKETDSGLAIPASEKALDIKRKFSWLKKKRDKIYNGTKYKAYKCIAGATATLLSNHVLELFVMQKYFIPEILKENGIHTASSWAKVYIGSEVNWEPSVLGDGFREHERPFYINTPELKRLNSIAFDIQMINETLTNVPKSDVKVIECIFDKQQELSIEDTLNRAMKIKTKLVDKSQDNMLNVMNDSKTLCLDSRMYMIKDSELYSDYLLIEDLNIDSSKIRNLCDNVYEMYTSTNYMLGTQLIFCDTGVNDINGFNLFDRIKEKLISLGIPKKEIILSRDITNETKRAKFQKDMNNGKVRVALGTTEKFGEAINVQKRMCAVHNLNIPWRPKDFIQRIGRAVRPGNSCETVKVVYYISCGNEFTKIKGSVESYIYWLMEIKRKNLHDFIYGDFEDLERELSIEGKETITYAEMAAIANGNDKVKEKLKLESEIKKLELLKRSLKNNILYKKHESDSLVEEAKYLEYKIESYEKFKETRNQDYDISDYNWYLLTDMMPILDDKNKSKMLPYLQEFEENGYIKLSNNPLILEFLRKISKSSMRLKFMFRGFIVDYKKESRYDISWIVNRRNYGHYYEVDEYIETALDEKRIEEAKIQKNKLLLKAEEFMVDYENSVFSFEREDELNEKYERLQVILDELEEAKNKEENEKKYA